jgi:hypothetical protein
MKLEFSLLMSEKYPNIKFRENPFIRNRVGPCGQTDKQTDMTKLIVAFCKFAKVAKNLCTLQLCYGCNNEQIFSMQHLLMILSNGNGLHLLYLLYLFPVRWK